MNNYKDKNWLFNQYIELKKSMKEIGKLCNVNGGAIHYWLKKFNIETRSVSESTKIAMNKPEIKKRHKKALNKPETKEKMSISQKIRFSDPKERKKASELHKGIKQSKEHIKKRVESIKKTYQKYPEKWKKSEESKKKSSESHKGKKQSEKTKKKISESLRGKKRSDEIKKKMSESMKKYYQNHPEKINERSGEKNYNWKGDNAGVTAIHIWIRKNKPKQKNCEICGLPENYENLGKLELSNISGDYKRDINDYRWVHHSCHFKFDYKNKTHRKGKMLEQMELEEFI